MKNPRIKGQKATRVKTRSEKKTLGTNSFLCGCPPPPRHIADKNVNIQPVTCSKISRILLCQFLGGHDLVFNRLHLNGDKVKRRASASNLPRWKKSRMSKFYYDEFCAQWMEKLCNKLHSHRPQHGWPYS